jgi:2-amino-4-hydroxy-6-hydroxymethyldihydropteridine diphosphokinase
VVERAFLSLGSNIEPERNLPRATAELTRLGSVLAVSTVYRNPAVGPTPQPDFLNAAVLLETALSPAELRDELRRLEAQLGRRRGPDKYAPRTIDIDLVLSGSRVLIEPDFALPDPGLLVQAHVSIPLAELDPDFRHPVTGERLAAIAERLRPAAVLTAEPGITREVRLAAGLDPAAEG